MDGGCECGDWRCSQRSAFGAALYRLVGGLRGGADTAELVAACEASMAALPVRTLADAAAALDVEVAALEAEGPDGETETEDLAAGDSAELEVNFENGSYELYCPIGNHRDLGMTTDVEVSG